MAIVPSPGLPNFPEILDMDKTSIPRVHENSLSGSLHFLYYPTTVQLRRYHNVAMSMSRPPDAPSEPIFVGQVPHLIPVEIIGWVLDTLLKRYSVLWMARGRKTGCVKAWVTNRADLEALLEFSKCVMFDLNGVWYTSVTDKDLRSVQVLDLEDYCARIKAGQAHVDARLPKGSMVLELVGQPRVYHPMTTLEALSRMQHRRTPPTDQNEHSLPDDQEDPHPGSIAKHLEAIINDAEYEPHTVLACFANIIQAAHESNDDPNQDHPSSYASRINVVVNH